MTDKDKWNVKLGYWFIGMMFFVAIYLLYMTGIIKSLPIYNGKDLYSMAFLGWGIIGFIGLIVHGYAKRV